MIMYYIMLVMVYGVITKHVDDNLLRIHAFYKEKQFKKTGVFMLSDVSKQVQNYANDVCKV